jgi:hypothetical protein
LKANGTRSEASPSPGEANSPTTTSTVFIGKRDQLAGALQEWHGTPAPRRTRKSNPLEVFDKKHTKPA